MPDRDNSLGCAQATHKVRPEIVEQVQRYFESRDSLRRGICLLNAGCHQEAVKAFSAAKSLNPDSAGLAEYLVRAYMGCGDYTSAAEQVTEQMDRDPDDMTSRVRHALLFWKNGDCDGAIASLRQSIASAPDCAELHFQLGNLLAHLDESEEAEMRFTLTVELDPRHADAMVSLAMCHAAREQPDRALRLLQKAQSLKPQDARIGLLLGMALQATNGHASRGNALCAMPSDLEQDDRRAMQALSKIIEGDPEFLEAFTALSADQLLYGLLIETIRQAIENRPGVADLQYHLGGVLDRVGRIDEAISATEETLAINPGHIRALIRLAKLYRKTNRIAEATDQLNIAIRLGARYADVYMLLGCLYRDSGRSDDAREAYRQALGINENYSEVRVALEALSGPPC